MRILKPACSSGCVFYDTAFTFVNTKSVRLPSLKMMEILVLHAAMRHALYKFGFGGTFFLILFCFRHKIKIKILFKNCIV